MHGHVDDGVESGDLMGWWLKSDDFNGDGKHDLAIGVPSEDVGIVSDAGAVQIIYGSNSGLSATVVPDQVWHQDSANVEGTAEAGDAFGGAVALYDIIN